MKKRFILAILATIALLAAGCGTLTTSSSNPSSGTAGAETAGRTIKKSD